MDAETQSRIDQAKRPPKRGEFRRPFAVDDVPDDAELSEMPPAERRAAIMAGRASKATREALDRMVPLEVRELEDGRLEYRVTTECSMCHEEMVLNYIDDATVEFEDGEEGELAIDGPPGLTARAIVAGFVRRRRFGFACDACLAKSEAEEARAKLASEQRDRLAVSNLDSALRGFEFEQMVNEEGRGKAIAAARSWAAEEYPDPRGLCLYGEKGAGKTRLAATAAWQRLRRYSLTWISWPILLAQLGAAFNDSARARAISVLTGRGALVLDDIDKSNPSEWAKTQLFAGIDKRITSGSPLLITTNLPPSELGEKFGEPIMSRIATYCDVVEMPGRDQRLRFKFDGSERDK